MISRTFNYYWTVFLLVSLLADSSLAFSVRIGTTPYPYGLSPTATSSTAATTSTSASGGSTKRPSTMAVRMSSDAAAAAASGTKKAVTVVGGTGFVGSRVCKLLVAKGASVTSLSTSGTVPKWATEDDQTWTDQVTWKAVNALTASTQELDTAMNKPDAVISCIGAVGFDPDELLQGNGQANVNVFESAKRINTVQSVAYVSVSSEVAACKDNWLPEFFKSYFEGKDQAEAAAKDVVCSKEDGDSRRTVIIVRPSFIYGGDSFGIAPPRVNAAYGSFIDQLLSFGFFQAVADVTPGLIKVALRPPVAVEAVAGACVNGVLLLLPPPAPPKEEGGTTTVRILDSAKAINDAAEQPPATGVQDFVDGSIRVATDIFEWVQARIEQQQQQGSDSSKK